MIKLLIGGSPCTHWSIAQSKNRETKAEGIGWELFENYEIAKEKFKPDFFLYENNWSASKEIKDQIQKELGCELMRINSKLVSAQNRDRFYVFNWEVKQPEDRGVLLKDILETADYVPYNPTSDDKSHTLTATYFKIGENLMSPYGCENAKQRVAIPVRVGTYPTENGELKGSQGQRIYSVEGKSVTQSANGGGQGAKTRLYAVPCSYNVPDGCEVIITENSIRCQRNDKKHSTVQGTHVNFLDGKSQTVSVAHVPKIITPSYKPIYEVKNGMITIKDKTYPIKLKDGYYIIRKLTPVECERLQTMPCTKTALLFDFEKMEVYSEKWFIEHQNRNARSAEGKCLRSQRLVSLAERLEESEFALYVEKNLSSNYRQTEKPAHLNARISTEENNSPTECSGVTLNSMSTAEKNLEFRKVGQSEDFAQLIVGMHSLLTKTQHLGKVELHQNGKLFAIAENGKMQLLLSGEEIMQLAEDVAKNTNTSLKHIISTISEVGQSTKNLEQILTTLFFFALNATDMFTQIKTQKKVLLLTEREYTAAVSNTQRYKGLGNGWTAEVIIHILQGALKDVSRDEKIVVLSMYDGIGTGRYCLDKMGFTNVEYHAYEIDKYAIKVAMSNYPDIIQHGDAFQIRNENWIISL